MPCGQYTFIGPWSREFNLKLEMIELQIGKVLTTDSLFISP